MANVTRILIIRFSSIGDIVLTSPVVRRLKEQLDGEVELHYLTKEQYLPLLEHNPHLTKIHTIQKATAEVIEDLKAIGFDYVIDLHRNVRSYMVKRELKSLHFTLKKFNFEKWLLVRFGIDRMPNKHIVDRYLDTIAAFSTQDDGKGLELFLGPEEQLAQADLPSALENGYVALALGGAHEGKRMTPDQVRAICDGITKPVVLLGGPQEADLGNELEAIAPGRIFNYAGKVSVLQSAWLIRKSKVVISGDTGMMHIASAFQVPIISVWGCTTPSLGMSPYKPAPGSQIMEPKDRPKRPCSKLGDRCKYGMDQKCITQVSITDILDATNALF